MCMYVLIRRLNGFENDNADLDSGTVTKDVASTTIGLLSLAQIGEHAPRPRFAP